MLKKSLIASVLITLAAAACAFVRAEVKVMETDGYVFSIIPYLRLDLVTLKNAVDLDSKNSDDTSTYLGLDYSLGFDLKSRDSGPEFFLKLERNGPYDYDAPLFIHNTLRTSAGEVERYSENDILPRVEEFWADIPAGKMPLRLKSGLFAYDGTGYGFASAQAYENYGFSLYSAPGDIKWRVYYCKPDLANKNYLGPRIKQERAQGIDYERNKANFFSADMTLPAGKNTFQPYAQLLTDRSGDSRLNLFSTPTHEDLLGTVGVAWNFSGDDLSIGVEMARNFGKAKSSDEAFKDTTHAGYMLYAEASYAIRKFIPHLRSALASGNKVTTEMVDNGDATLTSGKNRAFSSYSPFNTNLADSIYPNVETVPLVAMGGGWGLNYGINRPGTFADARLFDNLVLANLGFDYKCTDKLTITVDWWYLRSKEKGVGTFAGESRELSADLGHEIDVSFNYALNERVTLSLLTGYFLPGSFYKEERDDTAGSLFTPFVRGDEGASPAYQVELSLTVSF